MVNHLNVHRAKLASETLAELCSQIGLDIVESSNLLNGVCQSRRRKIWNAVDREQSLEAQPTSDKAYKVSTCT